MDLAAEKNAPPLSSYTNALLHALETLPPHTKNTDESIGVSKTVSFFALLYERVRNAMEFREEHLVRRAAIERILKRRLAINPKAQGEGENLVRELLWARYIGAENVSHADIAHLQKTFDHYIMLKQHVFSHHKKFSDIDAQFWMDMLTTELEEALDPTETEKKRAYLYFFYQVLKNKVQVAGVSEEDKNSYFLAACELSFLKNDHSYIRQHFFSLSFGPVAAFDQSAMQQVSDHWPTITKKIDHIITSSPTEKLIRFARKQAPPFLILFDVLSESKKPREIVSDKTLLEEKVHEMCAKKYEETGKRLQTAAVRSIIYIFLTKMIFVILLEMPLTQYFYGELDFGPLAINSLFPPLFMGLIVSFLHVPGAKNTKRIYERIVDIIHKDPATDTNPLIVKAKSPIRRPLLFVGFSALYIVTFSLTFAAIYYVLSLLGFHLLGMGIFIFFISVVAFFGYRIRQTAKEYSLEESENIFTPFVHFLFLPILSVGKFLSREIARLNVLMFVFDVLIEAPFKLLFEIVEEWVKFVRARKEEIM